MSSNFAMATEEPEQTKTIEPTREKNDFLAETWARIKSFTVPRVSNDSKQISNEGDHHPEQWTRSEREKAQNKARKKAMRQLTNDPSLQ